MRLVACLFLLLFATSSRADQLAATVNFGITFPEKIPQSSLGIEFDIYPLDGQFPIELADSHVGVPHVYHGHLLSILNPDVGFTARVYPVDGFIWPIIVPMDGTGPYCITTCTSNLVWHQPFASAFSNSIWTLTDFERVAAEPTDPQWKWYSSVTVTAQFYQAVPDPSAALLLIFGCCGLHRVRRWRKKMGAERLLNITARFVDGY